MSKQPPLDLPPAKIDLGKFVIFSKPACQPCHYRVSGIGTKRAGQVGQHAGTIGLRHCGGYEVLLQFEDGKVESFSPMSLFPEVS